MKKKNEDGENNKGENEMENLFAWTKIWFD